MSHIAVLQVANAVPTCDRGKCFPILAVCLLNAGSKTYLYITAIQEAHTNTYTYVYLEGIESTMPYEDN